jgi:hypothetical protein
MQEGLYAPDGWTYSCRFVPELTDGVAAIEVFPSEAPEARIATPLLSAHTKRQPPFGCVTEPVTETLPASGDRHVTMAVPPSGGRIANPPAGTPPIVEPVVFSATNPSPPSDQPERPPAIAVEKLSGSVFPVPS